MNPHRILCQIFYMISLILVLTHAIAPASFGAGGLDLSAGDPNASDSPGGDNSGDDGSSDDGSGNNDGSNGQNDPQQDPRQNMFNRPASKPVECFGIMGDGQNDNVFVGEDGHQYGYGEAPACHPQGSIKLPADNPQMCENIVVGQTVKGELIRGSLKADLSRHAPVTCYPYDFVKKQITYMNPDYATPMQ
jgi:hypothetical protein